MTQIDIESLIKIIENTEITPEQAKASIARSELPENNKESKPIDKNIIYNI